ncbi:MAG: hypothetical protein LBB80_03525, partial [Treponema sp.]|nr:hypothetical protein [Treponema sp.]
NRVSRGISNISYGATWTLQRDGAAGRLRLIQCGHNDTACGIFGIKLRFCLLAQWILIPLLTTAVIMSAYPGQSRPVTIPVSSPGGHFIEIG